MGSTDELGEDKVSRLAGIVNLTLLEEAAVLTDIDPSLGLEVSQENQEKSLEHCGPPPTIGVPPGTGSVETGVSIDQRRRGFQCCVHSADRALLVCVSDAGPWTGGWGSLA